MDYIEKLGTEIHSQIEQLKSFETEKMKSCLNQLLETKTLFSKVLRDGIESLFVSVKSYLKTAISDYCQQVKLFLSETEYQNCLVLGSSCGPEYSSHASSTVSSSIVGVNSQNRKFILILDKIIFQYKEKLTEAIFASFLSIVCDLFIRELENSLYQKCNEYGALILEKSIRTIISYMVLMSSYFIKDKFSKILTISLLFNMDKTEFSDIKISGKLKYLNKAEIWKLLSMKYSREDLMDIKNYIE